MERAFEAPPFVGAATTGGEVLECRSAGSTSAKAAASNTPSHSLANSARSVSGFLATNTGFWRPEGVNRPRREGVLDRAAGSGDYPRRTNGI